MAFTKYAKAALVKPAISFEGWDEIRHASSKESQVASFNARKAAKVVLEKFDPGQFLLSHCTIIASVSTEPVKAPLGRLVVDNFQVERKYADWYVTPDTLKYI